MFGFQGKYLVRTKITLNKASDMKSLRSIKRYARRHRLCNDDVREELKVFNISDCIACVSSMPNGKLPYVICLYKPV